MKIRNLNLRRGKKNLSGKTKVSEDGISPPRSGLRNCATERISLIYINKKMERQLSIPVFLYFLFRNSPTTNPHFAQERERKYVPRPFHSCIRKKRKRGKISFLSPLQTLWKKKMRKLFFSSPVRKRRYSDRK